MLFEQILAVWTGLEPATPCVTVFYFTLFLEVKFI